MGQNLIITVNACISLYYYISFMRQHFNPQLLISTLASSAHILYVPLLESAKDICAL